VNGYGKPYLLIGNVASTAVGVIWATARHFPGQQTFSTAGSVFFIAVSDQDATAMPTWSSRGRD